MAGNGVASRTPPETYKEIPGNVWCEPMGEARANARADALRLSIDGIGPRILSSSLSFAATRYIKI